MSYMITREVTDKCMTNCQSISHLYDWYTIPDYLGDGRTLAELSSHNLSWGIWALRCCPEYERIQRLFAVWCSRKVEHLHTVCKVTLDTSELYAWGLATAEDLGRAHSAASFVRSPHSSAPFAAPYFAASAAFSASAPYTAAARGWFIFLCI